MEIVSDYADLIARLHKASAMSWNDDYSKPQTEGRTRQIFRSDAMLEAADAIEALVRERDELRASLAARDAEIAELTERCANISEDAENELKSAYAEMSGLRAQLTAAAEREAKLRGALLEIAEHKCDYADIDAEFGRIYIEAGACEDCRRASARNWPPSGLCDKHFGERDRLHISRRRLYDAQHHDMRDVARAALAALAAKP